MKKRVVSLLMVCAMSVGLLAGCGSSNENQNQATGSADNTQTAGTEVAAESKTPEVTDDANLTATQQIIMHRITAVEHHRQACHNTQPQVLPQW